MFQFFILTLCTLLCCGPWLGAAPAAWLPELCSCCWSPVLLVPGSRCQYTRMKRLLRTASVLDMARLASSFFVYWINAASGSPPNTTWIESRASWLCVCIWWNKFFSSDVMKFRSAEHQALSKAAWPPFNQTIYFTYCILAFTLYDV